MHSSSALFPLLSPHQNHIYLNNDQNETADCDLYRVNIIE